MWTRVELTLRRAARALLESLGTPAMTGALLALAAIAQVVAHAWARRSPAAADAFSTSSAFEAIALALVVDAAATLLKAFPSALAPAGPRVPPSTRSPAVAVRVGVALVSVGFALSLLGRDAVRLRVAEREEATGGPEQIVGGEALRRLSRGAGAVRFQVESVDADIRTGAPATDVAVYVRTPGGARTATAIRPLWHGWTRVLWPEDAGYALRYEIAAAHGPVLDGAVAKLDLSTDGSDSFRSPAIPHRVLVTSSAASSGGAGPAFDVAVYRGKLLVASGSLAPGGALEFEGLVLRLPEVRRWVALRLVRDPGIPLALAGALLACGGLVGDRLLRRGRWRRAGPGW